MKRFESTMRQLARRIGKGIKVLQTEYLVKPCEMTCENCLKPKAPFCEHLKLFSALVKDFEDLWAIHKEELENRPAIEDLLAGIEKTDVNENVWSELPRSEGG